MQTVDVCQQTPPLHVVSRVSPRLQQYAALSRSTSAVHELLSSLVPIAFAAHALHSLLYVLSFERHICALIPAGLFPEVLPPEPPSTPGVVVGEEEGHPPTSLLNMHHGHNEAKRGNMSPLTHEAATTHKPLFFCQRRDFPARIVSLTHLFAGRSSAGLAPSQRTDCVSYLCRELHGAQSHLKTMILSLASCAWPPPNISMRTTTTSTYIAVGPLEVTTGQARRELSADNTRWAGVVTLATHCCLYTIKPFCMRICAPIS